MSSKSYEYNGYIITIGHQVYATKNGCFVCDGATEKDVEEKLDDLIDMV